MLLLRRLNEVCSSEPPQITRVFQLEEEIMSDHIVREIECKKRTGLSRTTRWRLESLGQFPKRRQLAPNSIGWLNSEIEKWLKSREVV